MAVTGGGAVQAAGDLAGLVVGPWPQWTPTFRLVRQLGDRGAEGTAYEAERLRRKGTESVATGELVALKVFDRDAFWRDKDAESRPLYERLHDLEELAHLLNEVPGVVRFRSPFLGPEPLRPGVEPDPSRPLRTYLPMELVEGPTLQQAIDATSDAVARAALLPRLGSLAETLRRFVEVRPEAPVSHRDVKPANLVLAAEDRLTLVDLGLLVSPRRSVTAGVGSFGFMAPEQQESTRLDADLAHRVDWFGFYATAACLLTGDQPPFSVAGWDRWLNQHRDQITPRARELLLSAATATPKNRPAPWLWLPRLMQAQSDARRTRLIHRVRRRRSLVIGAAAALALGMGGVAIGSESTGLWSGGSTGGSGSGRALPSTSASKTFSAATTWPLQVPCDGTTAVAMPNARGGRSRFSGTDPRPAMVQAGAVGWRSGSLTVRITNPTGVPALLAELQPLSISEQLSPPAWVYRPHAAPTACPRTHVDRRFLLDMDHMGDFAADGYRARTADVLGRPRLLFPAHTTTILGIDVRACTGNFEFGLLAKLVPQGSDKVVTLDLGNFQIDGDADHTQFFTGSGGPSATIPACVRST